MTTHSILGSRRWSRGAQLAVWSCALFLVAALVPGCGLDSPSSPNSPGDLQGNNPNQWSNFTGSVRIVVPSTDLPADDTTALPITAVVQDDSGRPVTNLTPVTFRTDMGTFGDPTATYAADSITVGSFGGSATADLRSFQRDYGDATVYATVGNVAAEIDLNLEYVKVEGTLSLAFRVQGQDFFNMTGAASPASPFRAGIVGMATDATGNPLAGVKVNFRIIIDDTTSSGAGGSELDGEPTSYTDTNGEAFNQLKVVGIGRVVLEADLIDPITDELVGTSNQIIMTTISSVRVSLLINDALTATGAGTKNLKATVFDEAGKAVDYAFVKFEIQGADGTGTGYLTPASTVATEWGIARATLGYKAGYVPGTTTVVAKVVDSNGEVLATSNTVENTIF